MIARLGVLGLGAMAIAAAFAFWIEHRTPQPRMMLIGGKESPCTCTQRIEP